MPTINKKMIRFGPEYKIKESDGYNYYTKYYNRQDWKDLRNLYLERHPVCEICEKHGRIVPAEHVHHCIPWTRGKTEKDKEKLLLNEKNLISVCKKCHKLLHEKDDGIIPLDQLSDNEYNKRHQIQFLK